MIKHREHLEPPVKETATRLRMAHEQVQQEMTERKRAERAVQEAREYAESIVETVREPLVVLDTDLRVISVNPSFCQTFKVTPEQARIIFFAYIGFDAVSTAAEETKNPQKNMPIGIMLSLAICTVLYILVAAILTGMVSYKELNHPAPVATR